MMAQPCNLNAPMIPALMPEPGAAPAAPRLPVMTAHAAPSPDNQDRHYQQLALLFIALATGAKSGNAIDDSRIRRYVSQPSPSHRLAVDRRWSPDPGSDALFDAWANAIRGKNAAALAEGPHAYAAALMRTIFPQASPAVPLLPVAIYRTWIAIDRMALEQALDAGVDFVTLDKFCSRIHRQFLLNAFLLPSLRVQPDDFPEPCPPAVMLRDLLVEAFAVHADATLGLLTRYTEGQLSAAQKARLTRLHKEYKVRLLLEENGSEIDALGRLKQEFFSDAIGILDDDLDHPGYALNCLLEAYFSYPQRVLDDLRRLEADAVTLDDPQLEKRRSEFQRQHRHWKADLDWLARHRSSLDELGEHGREYFLGRLHALSRAAYRPRLRPPRLEHMLAAARLQPDVIAEEAEPPQ